jgi:glycosyltransferase involved in cell wall biosynthesis
MAETKDKFSVVVPVLNSKDHLCDSLTSILAAVDRYRNAELIVLDNGSDDGSYEILLNEYSHCARIQQIRGISVSALRNHGARLANGEFIAFLDSDCIIAPDYFDQALHILRDYADATGSQPMLEPDSPHWIERTWHDIQLPDRDEFVKAISSGNFVIKRQAFFAVGGFDEKMISDEDDDLGIRLNDAGFKLYQARAVRAIHAGADDSLRVFFFKSAWRSMGMFRMMKHSWMSKPLLITFAHLLFCIAAPIYLFASHASWPTRIAVFLVLVTFAPAITVVYRMLQVRRLLYAPLRLMLLYHVYFIARFYTLWKMLMSIGASPERKIAMSARLHNSAKAPE